MARKQRRRNYQIKKRDSDNKWVVRKESSSRASRVFDRKKQALRWGKSRAKEVGTSLEIYTADGRHQETDTYATTSKESTNDY